jgi:pseudouridine-5'-phosphate glycosidase/pseudouridine kinase
MSTLLLRSLAASSRRRLTSPISKLASTWVQSIPFKRNAPLDIHPEIQQAFADGKPVVALETALVTHGFPYPHNLDISLSMEDIVRSTGSIPATIGMVRGRVKVGMTKGELERLADKNASPSKISRRDIAPAIALKADGGAEWCDMTQNKSRPLGFQEPLAVPHSYLRRWLGSGSVGRRDNSLL